MTTADVNIYVRTHRDIVVVVVLMIITLMTMAELFTLMHKVQTRRKVLQFGPSFSRLAFSPMHWDLDGPSVLRSAFSVSPVFEANDFSELLVVSHVSIRTSANTFDAIVDVILSS